MKTVLILLAALPLLAADATDAKFSGRVVNGDGTRKITNAIVTVTTPAGYIASVETNNAGEFAFDALPVGEYDFRVTAHGYAIYERQVTVSTEAGVRALDIRMLVPADKQTVSVAELRNIDVTRADRALQGQARRGF
jgi:hypothetical protein